MVLDLTSGRLADAISHAEKALQSVQSRLIELQAGLAGQLPPLADVTENAKGKGKASGNRLIRDDYVQNMSKTQIESEIKELSGLKDDLALKVCAGVIFVDARFSSLHSGRRTEDIARK